MRDPIASISGKSRHISGPSGLKFIVAMNCIAVIKVDFRTSLHQNVFLNSPMVHQSTDPFRQHSRKASGLNRTVLPTGSCTNSWAEVAGKEHLKSVPQVSDSGIRIADSLFEVVLKIF